MSNDWSMIFFELIDTLWNVNICTYDVDSNDATGINRYIMECKLNIFILGRRIGRELIDTLWNVNIMDGKYFSVIKKELIDTLWNVNEGTLNAICCQSRN